MLRIDAITCRVAGRTLLDGASATIPNGHKVGLVGRNGVGKTTLLRLIVGEIAADGGAIELPRGARIGTIAQEAPDGPESLIDTVLAADVERTSLLGEAESATEPARIAEIHTRLADIRAHEAPARAARILAGLGFDERAQALPCRSLSGGWRMRVALAAVLFAEPDLLLLDEPTNHLDLEASLWLQGYIRSYPRTIITVSHDRDLLNGSVGHILHLEAGKLTLYTGGYDAFERTRLERLEHTKKLARRQAAEQARIQAFVERFRYKATKARQAQSRLKALARMTPVAAVLAERTPRFNFPEPVVPAPPLVVLEEAAAGYEPDKPVLQRLNLRLDPDERIALIGANGNGKSTFAKLIAGRLQPLAGALRRSPKLAAGYFAQHQLDELAADNSAFENLAAVMPRAREPLVRARLGGFGFSAERADVPARSMSGGERARLVLAMMAASAPNLLILDEPTNHLDVDARESLVQALAEFPGAVLLITHDSHLINAVADRLWLVADGTVTPYDGDLASYGETLFAARERNGAGARSGNRDERKARRRADAEARQALAADRRRLREAEVEIDRLTAEKARVESELADPATYDSAGEAIAERTRELAAIERRLKQAEARWLALSEALESAS